MWKRITVEQYQQLDAINGQDLDDLDKVIAMVSVVFNKPEEDVLELYPKQFNALAVQIGTMFTAIPNRAAKRIIQANGKRYAIDYNIGQYRLAQYVEAQHFLKAGLIPNLHLIAASLSSPYTIFRKGKNDSENHAEIAENFKQANFLDTYTAVVFFCQHLTQFNRNYAGLFGTNEEGEEGESHPFNSRYGWIYSATQIKEHEGIPLSQVWDLNIVHALNVLAYLKSYTAYTYDLNKKARALTAQ